MDGRQGDERAWQHLGPTWWPTCRSPKRSGSPFPVPCRDLANALPAVLDRGGGLARAAEDQRARLQTAALSQARGHACMPAELSQRILVLCLPDLQSVQPGSGGVLTPSPCRVCFASWHDFASG